MGRKRQKKMMPARVLVLGFAAIILVGMLILMLPICSADGTWTDPLTALFTATTSVCVTGLVMVPTYSHWSLFGQWIILFLIEVGGLGFMTFTSMAIVIMGRKISLQDRLLMQESLGQNTMSGLVRLMRNVLVGTLIVQGIGALLLAFWFCPRYGIAEGIYYGIFHSISAFCNAGLDVLGPDSLMPWVNDYYLNIVIMLLIILGGLGYVVWLDVLKAIKQSKHPQGALVNYSFGRRFWRNCSLYTKLVLTMTGGLILFGWIGFGLLEWGNPKTLGSMSVADGALAALFQSVTTRTAGFAGIDQGRMTDNAKVLSSILMFIGGSSGSTAGGIKTVTLAVLLLTIKTYIRGRSDVEVYGRRVSLAAARRAFSLVICAFTAMLLVTMVMGAVEDLPFVDVLFEVASAIGTTGLTTGITAGLTSFSQMLLILLMYVGRVGPLTVMMALSVRQEEKRANIHWPEEEVMIG